MSRRKLDPETGRHIVRGVPLLVIDDEADYASVNTKARPTDENGATRRRYDPSKINGWIRRLLRTFEKSAYLGYTATPFANIFIDEDEETGQLRRGPVPAQLHRQPPAPTNYTGAVRVFGLDADVTAGIEADAGLPAIRTVADNEAWLPDKHKKDWIPGELPDSLVEATNAFLLATAARRARGQRGHNSMLVHVTRFTAVQAHRPAQPRAITSACCTQGSATGSDDSPTSPWPSYERCGSATSSRQQGRSCPGPTLRRR